MVLQLQQITSGEKLVVQRRRLKQNQREAAKAHGVSRNTYAAWELDLATTQDVPDTELSQLEDREACWLLRRRGNWSQDTIAEEIGCSRVWVANMELGQWPCTQLVEYWTNEVAKNPTLLDNPMN